MKYNKSLLGCCLLFILSSATTTAQYYSGDFINKSITLRSDFPSKSVLVTNIADYGIGDNSPLLIAASWSKNGSQSECRSLLEFNYTLLPAMLVNDPSMIYSAELILYPINSVPDDINKPVKFIVKRIVEAWEDSVTVWLNQPSIDSSMQVTKLIKVKQKSNPVTVDVTELVMGMLRFGNNGFMICPENSPQESMAAGQLFASPKNENENLRPMLVINYADPTLSLRSQMEMRLNQSRTTPEQRNTMVTQPIRTNQ